MSQVDWSKAPEGATHYCLSWPARTAWRDMSGIYAKYYMDGAWRDHGVTSEYCLTSYAEFEARPAQWNGEGLPPAGTVCEHKRVHEWQKVEIFAVKPNYNGSQTALFTYESGCWAGCAEPSLFRPIRTPEQVAAEECQREISEIHCNLVGMAMSEDDAPKGTNDDWYRVAEFMHGKGYRKQVAP